MSVTYNVLPITPKTYEVLEALGYKVSNLNSRLPTLDELLDILETLYPSKVKKEQVNDNLVDIVVGVAYSSPYAEILGSTEEAGFDFHFIDSETATMIEILKYLSIKCGPLIIYESMATTPLLVDTDTDIEKAVLDWNKRFQDRMDDH